ESVHRLIRPVEIAFDQAILVAVLGLIVNGACVFILGHRHEHHDDEHPDGHHHHHHDHNLRSAYLHVLADALTSVLAIVALLLGKFLAWNFMDPVMGIVGAILVSRWAIGLSKQSGRILLDAQAPEPILIGVRRALESNDGTRLTDVHIWSIGPGIYAAALMVSSPSPRSPEEYKNQIPRELGIRHITLEVQGEPG
ncbi:MAG: cation transporter, partial [Rhodothermales bacterium]|nr:cation transporter [Rhodothermales bacterium]